MFRLAGYQVFCWLAIAFITLGGTSSRAAFLVLGCGIAISVAGAAIGWAAIRRIKSAAPRP